jgi:hypothetical protein
MVTTLAVTRATPTPSPRTSRACADGWKTDLEGGRVTLVAIGELRGNLTSNKWWMHSSSPVSPHNRCATSANESLTFTLPNEVSLCAEGDPEEAKAAMYAAAQKSLDAIYGDKRYTAGAAIHTRNENGEIHYHAHVLVGKFAEDRATAKLWSLKSRGGGNTGHRQLTQPKTAWKEGLDRDFRERFTIEQRTTRRIALERNPG